LSNRVKCDVEGAVVRLDQIGEKALRGIYGVMQDEGKIIEHLAKLFAPVDDGYLEDAIKTDDTPPGRTALGRFGRGKVSVYIDMSMPADGAKVVGDYAMRIHEGLAPYGSGAYQLGPKSIAKGGEVGGKFMERAANERISSIYAKVQNIVRRSL